MSEGRLSMTSGLLIDEWERFGRRYMHNDKHFQILEEKPIWQEKRISREHDKGTDKTVKTTIQSDEHDD